MIEKTRQTTSLLRKALISNAAFSGLSGTTLFVAAPWLSEGMGIPQSIILRVVGLSLLGFAVALILNATRAEVNRRQAWIAVALDFAWVLGSAALVSLQLLTASGNWAVVVVADVVLVLALAQTIGLRRAASRSQEPAGQHQVGGLLVEDSIPIEERHENLEIMDARFYDIEVGLFVLPHGNSPCD